MGSMQEVEELDLGTTPFCGCGKCIIGLVRLSSMTETTDSPSKQVSHCRAEAKANGAHIIGWAIDLDVSGATNPFERKGIGPWLKAEKGPYDGLVASAVDRIGRNLLDVLTVGYFMRDNGKLLYTRGHYGPWDLNDPIDEQNFSFQALGAQMEHRATKRRVGESADEMRKNGKKWGRLAHGYRYVRKGESRKVDHIAIDPEVLAYLEECADRLLADETGLVTEKSEARRLTMAGILTPADYRRVNRGLAPTGAAWDGSTLKAILISPATQGYYMHNKKPVLYDVGDRRGQKIRIAPAMWDYAKHEALIAKLTPKRQVKTRNPRTDHMMMGLSWCGVCGHRMYVDQPKRLADGSWCLGVKCKAQQKGYPHAIANHSKTDAERAAPFFLMRELEGMAVERFLADYGDHMRWEQAFDPGNDTAAQLAEAEAQAKRLREDRKAGLYDSEEDAEWFRSEYKKVSAEIAEFKAVPQRRACVYWRPSGVTVAELWEKAETSAAKRELMASYGFRAEIFPTSAAKRIVFSYNLDPEQAEEARRESWEAYQEALAVEAEYRERIEAEQAAADAEADQHPETPDDAPTTDDQANDPDLWTVRPAEDHDLAA